MPLGDPGGSIHAVGEGLDGRHCLQPMMRHDDPSRAKGRDPFSGTIQGVGFVDARPRVRACDGEPQVIEHGPGDRRVVARDIDRLDAGEPDLGQRGERLPIETHAGAPEARRIAEGVQLDGERLWHVSPYDRERAASRSWSRYHSPATGMNQGRPS